MFYFLHFCSGQFGPFRLFEYVTFRSGGAFFTAFLLSVLLIPLLLPFLRKNCTQKSTRTGGAVPAERPPVLGGVIIVGSILISTLLWGQINSDLLFVFLTVTVVHCILGMADDLIKVHYTREEKDGVSSRTKLVVQFAVGVLAVYWLYKTHGAISMQVFCPFSKQPFQFLPGTDSISVMLPYSETPLFQMPLKYMPVCLLVMLGFNSFVLAGTSNGVNLADGKDGLASGCMLIASLAFAVIAYLYGHAVFARYLGLPYIAGAGEVGVFACAAAGSCLGFLWHNCQPAKLYMGDSGSLALGAALAMIAIMLGQQLLLPVIGFIFVIESLSSMIQTFTIRHCNGKKLFLMAPIHHHYVKKGWENSQVVIRFWIVAFLAAVIGLATLKLR